MSTITNRYKARHSSEYAATMNESESAIQRIEERRAQNQSVIDETNAKEYMPTNTKSGTIYQRWKERNYSQLELNANTALKDAAEYQRMLEEKLSSNGKKYGDLTSENGRASLSKAKAALDKETYSALETLYDEGDKAKTQNEAAISLNATDALLKGNLSNNDWLTSWGNKASNVARNPLIGDPEKTIYKSNAEVVSDMSDAELGNRISTIRKEMKNNKLLSSKAVEQIAPGMTGNEIDTVKKSNEQLSAELSYLEKESQYRAYVKTNPEVKTNAYSNLMLGKDITPDELQELKDAIYNKHGISPLSRKLSDITDVGADAQFEEMEKSSGWDDFDTNIDQGVQERKAAAENEIETLTLLGSAYQAINNGDSSLKDWKKWHTPDEQKIVTDRMTMDSYNTARQKESEAWQLLGEKSPILSDVFSSAMSLIAGIHDLPDQITMAITTSKGKEQEIPVLLGNEPPKANYSNIVTDIRAGVSKNMSETETELYQGVMSLQDNLARMAVGAAVGGGIPGLVINALTFGMGTTAQVTQQKLNAGMPADKALVYGLLNGAVEYATEALPFDAVINLAKSDLKKVIGSGYQSVLRDVLGKLGSDYASEALEEITSGIIDPLIDNDIFGQLSEQNQRKQELIDKGYTKEEASAIVQEEWVDDIIKSGTWGGIGGLLFGGANYYVSGKNANRLGSAIKKIGTESQLIESALKSADEDVIELAKQLKTDGSENYRNVGKLAQIMSQSKDDATRLAWESYYDNAIGENSALAKTFTKAQSDADIAREERASSIYEAQKASSNVFVKELTKAGLNETTANKKAGILSKILSNETVSNVQIKEVVRGSSPETRAILERELGVNLSNSNKDSIAIVKDAMKPSQIKGGSIWNKYSDDTEISYDAIDPERAKAVKVRTADGDVEMNLENVGANATELVFDTARQLSKSGAQQYVEGLTRDIKTISQLKDYTDTYLKAYTIGLTNTTHSSILESMLKNPGSLMSSESIWDAYIAGNKDYVARKERAQGGKKVNNPTVTYDSDVILNKERHKVYQGVTEATQKALEALASAAQVNVHVVKSIEPVVINGEAYKSNGYYLDGTIYLAADADNPLITVAKHELTHHIKETSGDAYFAYRDFLIHELMNKRGAKFNSMIESYAKVYGNLSREEILDEIAADATELFFTDRDTIIKFSKRFSRLAKTVKEFISALTPISAGETKTYAAKELDAARSVVKKAEKLWAEALSNTGTENKKSASTQSKERYSIGYTTDNQPVVVVDDNILAGLPKSQWIDKVKETISDKFSNGIPVSGRLIKVKQVTGKEYTRSKYSQNLRYGKKNVYQDKFKAANNLDEIVLASTNYVNEDLKHARKDNFKEFARGDVFIKVGGNDYSAKVIIGFTNRNDMVLYDIIGFTPAAFDIKKENSQPVITQNESLGRSGSSVEQSISNDKISVNTNSMQKSGNNSQEKYSLANSIDKELKDKYTDNEGGHYERTDEFRRIQAESQRMSDEDAQSFHSGSKQLDNALRRRLSRAFRVELYAERSRLNLGVRTLLNPKTGKSVSIVNNVSGGVFHDIFNVARNYLENGELVDVHDIKTTTESIGYEDCTNYLSEDGLCGFSITPNGDLISVFNVSGEKGFLKTIAPVVKESASTLDCYISEKQNLQKMYSRIFGFKTASIMDYNMEYDHDNIAVNYHNPQVAFMVNTDENIETRHFSKNEYNEAVAYRDSFIGNSMQKGENDTNDGKVKYSLSQSFAEQVDDVINNRHDPNNHIYMGNIPPRLSSILGLKKLPMLITSKHVFTMTLTEAQAKSDSRYNKKDHYHGLGKDVMAKLPKAIDKPVFIIKSNTDVNDARFVVATDLFDKQGNRIVVAVEPDGRGFYWNVEIKTNVALSGYGKKNFSNYIKTAKEENRILYAFNKYNQRNQSVPGVQFPDSILSADYSDNLTQFRKIVNSEYMQNQQNDSNNAERNQISHEEFERMAEKYGYHVVRDPNVKVPLQTNERNRVRRHVAMVMSDGNITAEMVEDLEDAVVKDLFSYEPSSDAKALEYAQQVIERGTAESDWKRVVNPIEKNKKEMKAPDKNDIALGETLLKQAIESGDRAKVVQLTAELSAIGTRTGQVVQAMSLLRKMTGVGTVFAVQKNVEQLQKELNLQYKNKAPKLEIGPVLMEQLAMEKDADKIAQIEEKIYAQVASQIKTDWADKLTAWRYLSMLGNLRTHLRNVFGNAAFVPVVRMKNAVQFALERTPLYRKARENGRTVSLVISKEYKNFAKADYDILKEDLQAGGKHNPTDAIRKRVRTFNTRWLERINQFNGNMLEAEDGAFLKLHYVHALGGYLQAQNVDLNNISEGILKAARTHAFQEALAATYRDASAIADAINRLGRKNAFLKVAVEGVLPFKKTPLNILKRGVEYSPMGLVKALSLDIIQVHKGNMTSYEMMNDLSKGMTGIGLTLIGYLLTSLGWIRGSGGDDKGDRFDELLGYQNYAIQGDGWSYTIDWMAPGSLPLFVGVELFNIFHDEYSSFGDYLNSFVSIADPVYDLSMLQGINTMIESAGYSDSSLTTIATTAVTSYLSQYVPTAAGQLARTIDGTRRTTFTEESGLTATLERMWDKTVNKIPGTSFTGAEYINQWGETETGNNSVLDVALRILENFVSPGYASGIEVDEAESLILDLYEKTGEASLFPKYAEKTITVNNESIRLTEAEYNKFAKRKGTLQHEIITELAKNSSFKSLSGADQAEIVSTVYTWAGQIAKFEINNDYRLPSSVAKMLAAEKEGISNAEFITVYKTINAYEADKDDKGQSISGSKKAKKVDYIENLSMTKAQKDWLLEEIA